MPRRRGGQFVSVKSNFYPERIQFRKTERDLIETLRTYYPEWHSFEIEGNVATIKVPEPDIGPWIGKGGSIKAAITDFLGVASVRIEPFEFE